MPVIGRVWKAGDLWRSVKQISQNKLDLIENWQEGNQLALINIAWPRIVVTIKIKSSYWQDAELVPKTFGQQDQRNAAQINSGLNVTPRMSFT